MDAFDTAWLRRLSLWTLRIMRDRWRQATPPRNVHALAGHVQWMAAIEDEIQSREDKDANDLRICAQQAGDSVDEAQGVATNGVRA